METMNKQKTQIMQDDHHHHQNTWGFIAKHDQESIEETSTISNGSSSISSCSSFDTVDDASSSSSSSLNSNESSVLDLSDLMSHLPIKRGLSKFYQGKSESFTSLARVMSIEDLPKRINNNNNNNNPYSNMRKVNSHSKIITKKLSSSFRQRSFARSTLVNKTSDGI